ncbi:MAG TPA: exonuclease domain-containing protein [Longimicrobiaceae bacterium]|nr:exonuclease domain-containing protein [Longimicrobiaceae bacterium]
MSGALAMGGVRFAQDSLLTRLALDVLAQAGPLSTPEVAARVLGIRGAAGPAARAVFALLGGDPRFGVSGEGVWSLAPAEPPPAPARPLRDEEWVVVDLETTGGSPKRGHRVTEVAAVRVAGGEIRDTWCTLVNPERGIPGLITALTGITQEMVTGAPRFHEVAGAVTSAIEGGVFVAHNAAFDWRFLCHELQRAAGLLPEGRQLCTVRLARKLLPELPSRSLDALALYFGVEIECRHRALDDAVATARVLIRFLEMLEERGAADWEGLQAVLKKRARRPRKRRASPRSMEAA